MLSKVWFGQGSFEENKYNLSTKPLDSQITGVQLCEI